MSRANNGVPVKTKNFANEGMSGGRAGTSRDMGGTPNQQTFTPREEDQSTQRGPYGSTIQAGKGTVKDMGGVGSYGENANEQKKGFFGDKH